MMVPGRVIAGSIFVTVALLAASGANPVMLTDRDADMEMSPESPALSSERLHVPMWPGAEPSVVAATYRGGAVDWVYYEASSDAVLLLLEGRGDPVKVFDDWLEPVGWDRKLLTLSAVWLDSGELHVYIAEGRVLFGLLMPQVDGYHAWWSPDGEGSEVVESPWLLGLPYSRMDGLRSDGTEVTLAFGTMWLTDLFLPTGMEASVVYTTRAGAFESMIELDGYRAGRAVPWQGDVIVCGGRHLGGEVAIARRSTSWEWEQVSMSAARMPSCDVAAGKDLKVFFYGFPLIGDGGGGLPGSGDGTEYHVAHWQDGSWEVESLSQEPHRGQWLMATPEEHFIVFYSREGEHNQETLVHDGAQWHVRLAVDGGDPNVVTRPRNPIMLVENAFSDLWAHEGWAALELVLR